MGNFEGIFPGSGSLIEGNTTNSNQDVGINASFGHCSVINNIANLNGIAGIYAARSLVSGNTAMANKTGIVAVCPTNLVGNSAVDNTTNYSPPRASLVPMGCGNSNNL